MLIEWCGNDYIYKLSFFARLNKFFPSLNQTQSLVWSNLFPAVQHDLVRLVHLLRVVRQQLQFFQVDLLEQSVDVDALVQLHDLLVQLRVLLVQHSVALGQLLVRLRQLLQLVLALAVGGLELLELDLERDELEPVVRAFLCDSVGVLGQRLHVLLELDLGVELLAGKTLLDLELLVHVVDRFVLELEVQLQLRDLFALGLKLNPFLIGFRHAPALESVLHLQVLLVDFALVAQDLIDLVLLHLLLALQLLDLGLLDCYLDLLLRELSLEGARLRLLPLEQVGVFQASLLLVLLPAEVDDVLVQLGYLVLILLAFLVLLLVHFVALARERLHLFDRAVGLRVLSAQLGQLGRRPLLLLSQRVLPIRQRVAIRLATIEQHA